MVEQLRETATQSLTEFQRHVTEMITKIAELLEILLERLSDPDVSDGDRSLRNGNDFDQVCQSFKNVGVSHQGYSRRLIANPHVSRPCLLWLIK